ncbi:kinesin-like protein Klp61F [Ostrinia nubilalis]|uniref:kinesin-like protein Klp61F n=1 Tax=Ostrinia nubilalis TaxID=29057 RepID=UPI0030822F99
MTSEKPSRKDKNQNIQVFVRLRPLNQRERDIKSLGVIEVVNNREVVVRQSQQTSHTKKFTFDRAFGPHAKQVEVYQEVVSPLIEEVLAGYNCTVFAYGQTGTGKTHTMVGENTGDETTWQNDPLAGIIPRALSQLFDELRISNTEYTVRVSYLELYNEELFDLLSTSEDNSKLRIYEDVTRKGSNIVNGLEEITVYNKNEVYKIMAQGQERKRVASTLMNAQSSRSHTVFTIVVHMKENSPEGEELVKIGKLNLVDLAGSENISKAGSDNPAKRERARECVNINQSLLTLGRVITALVERHPHIPYRESKLTRILQESLGGRTKTSIIATISPGHKDLEETMSTLEYAHRAKNIQNKPEVNQKMTKKAILKEYAEEIDRLKRDLQAARDKNGVYLASDTFAEMTLKQEEQRKEIQELLLKKRAMEEERDKLGTVFQDINQKLEHAGHQLNDTKNQLHTTKAKLADTNNVLQTTKLRFEEQRHLVVAQQQTEAALGAQARALLAAADAASKHASALHDTVDKRRSVESTNLEVTQTFRAESAQQREQIAAGAQHFTDSLLQTLNGLHSTLDNFTTNTVEAQDQNKNKLTELVQKLVDATAEIKTLTATAQDSFSKAAENHRGQLQQALLVHTRDLEHFINLFVSALWAHTHRMKDVEIAKDIEKFVEEWYPSAASRVAALRSVQAAAAANARGTETERSAAARRRRNARRAAAAARASRAQACIQEIEAEKEEIQKRLSKQLAEIETERQETESRLNQWMEEERRLLEERLARHVAAEKKALEDRLSRKVLEIEQEKNLLEERINRHVMWQQSQLEATKEDMDSADQALEEQDSEKEQAEKNLSKFVNEFNALASEVQSDMEWFSGAVVARVATATEHFIRFQEENAYKIDQEVKQLVQTDKESTAKLTADSDQTLAAVTRGTQQTLASVVEVAEKHNNLTADELNSLAASLSQLTSSSTAHLAAQTRTLEAVQHEAVGFGASLRSALDRHQQLEARYLMQEYRLTSSSTAHLAAQTRTLEAVQHEAVGFGASLRSALERHQQLEARYLMQEYRVYSPTVRRQVCLEARYLMQEYRVYSPTAASLSQLTSSSTAHLAAQTRTLEAVQHEAVGFGSSLRSALDRHQQLEARYLMQEYRVYSPTAASLSQLTSSSTAHLAAQTRTLEAVQHEAVGFGASLRSALDRHQQLEARYLMQEYRVYSPTAISLSQLTSSSTAHLAAQTRTLEAVQHEAVGFGSSLRSALDRHQQLEARYLMQEYRVYSPTVRRQVCLEARYLMQEYRVYSPTAISLSQLTSSSTAHLAAQTRTLEAVQHEAVGFGASLRSVLDRHQQLEARYLMQEYRVYSPTGQ